MRMERYKRGDIILNKYAGPRNPLRCFVYLGSNSQHTQGIELLNGRLAKADYYTKDVKQNPDKFVVVGHTDAFDVLKRDLKTALEVTADEQ